MIAVLTLALAFAAAEPAPPADGQAPDKSAIVGEAHYACKDGRHFRVVFQETPNVALVTFGNGDVFVLAQQPSGSGFAYGDGGKRTLRGKGEEAMWIIGRRAPLLCNTVD
jgi:membrane-bound inhibitor of C-type lysozyme